MARKRRLHRRYGKRKNPDSAPKFLRNPLGFAEIGEFVLPGFGAFAGTRLLTRLATVQISKRKPGWAKHAGAIASIGSFLAAWYGAHRVKALEKYHTPIVVGAALAAIQSIIQLYIPKLGWMIADSSPDIEAPQQLTTSPVQQQIASGQLTPVDEDPDWYDHDDKYDAGRYAKETQTQAPASSGHARKVAAEEDLLADLNLDDSAGAQNMGIFSN